MGNKDTMNKDEFCNRFVECLKNGETFELPENIKIVEEDISIVDIYEGIKDEKELNGANIEEKDGKIIITINIKVKLTNIKFKGKFIMGHHSISKGVVCIIKLSFNKITNFDGSIFKEDVDFSNTVFKGDITHFGDSEFEGEADFHDSTFENGVNFVDTIFNNADFSRATFKKEDANFKKATFKGKADFRKTKFKKAADFNEATFKDIVDFWNVKFNMDESHKGKTDFSNATFEKYVQFSFASFNKKVLFIHTTFEKEAYFKDAKFNGEVDFGSSTIFKGEADFKDAKFNGEVNFRSSVFKEEADFSSSTFNMINFEKLIFKSITKFTDISFGQMFFLESIFEDIVFFKKKEENKDKGIAIFNKVAFGNKHAKIINFPLSKTSFLMTDVNEILITEKAEEILRHKLLKFKEKGIIKDKPLKEIYEEALKYLEPHLDLNYNIVIAEYRNIRKSFENNRTYIEASELFKKEMELIKENANPFEKFIISIYGELSDYGESMFRPFEWMVFFIFMFPIPFLVWEYNSKGHLEQNYSYVVCLFDTLRAFFQLGIKDTTSLMYPYEWFIRVISLILLGNIFIAIKRRLERR
jgi:uncharacterized protein YjbI with pentapeptide repeats